MSEPHLDLSEVIAVGQSAGEEIAAAGTLEELTALRERLIGRDSAIARARRGLGDLPADQRPAAGKTISAVADAVTVQLEERRTELAAHAELATLRRDATDVSLPGRRPERGSFHAINQVMDEMIDIFVSIGYAVADGPEAETEFYNFTALNMPPTHPARLETDTLYLEYGDRAEEILLRTHTSPMQARYMEEHDPPVHVVVPGRVFRRDPLDATHSPVFHQMEGLAVAEGVTFADLKGTLFYFAKEFFGPATKVKFLPDYFPFTEPSAQMLVWTNDRWLELLGCGMVNPAVFEHVGYDPDIVTGFAFGMGADRMAMVRHGVDNLRLLLEPDVRVLRQFR